MKASKFKKGDRVVVKYRFAYEGIWQRGVVTRAEEYSKGVYAVLLDIENYDNVSSEALVLEDVYDSPLYKALL